MIVQQINFYGACGFEIKCRAPYPFSFITEAFSSYYVKVLGFFIYNLEVSLFTHQQFLLSTLVQISFTYIFELLVHLADAFLYHLHTIKSSEANVG